TSCPPRWRYAGCLPAAEPTAASPLRCRIPAAESDRADCATVPPRCGCAGENPSNPGAAAAAATHPAVPADRSPASGRAAGRPGVGGAPVQASLASARTTGRNPPPEPEGPGAAPPGNRQSRYAETGWVAAAATAPSDESAGRSPPVTDRWWRTASARGCPTAPAERPDRRRPALPRHAASVPPPAGQRGACAPAVPAGGSPAG